MAIYGGQPPSDYYARQDARKDDKFRDIINLFLQLKQMKTQTSQFDEEKALQERELGIKERQVESLDAYRQRPQTYAPSDLSKRIDDLKTRFGVDDATAFQMLQQMNWKPPEVIEQESAARARGAGTGAFAPTKTPEQIREEARARAQGAGTGMFAPDKTPEQIESESEARARGAGTGKFAPPKPRTPTDYDRRVSAAQEDPTLSPEEKKNIIYGIPMPKIDEGPTATTLKVNRDRTLREVRDTYTKYYNKELFKDPVALEEWRDIGYHFDMPRRYNEALMLRVHDQATEQELAYLEKADKTKQILQEKQVTDLSKIPPDIRRVLDMEVARLFVEVYGKALKKVRRIERGILK